MEQRLKERLTGAAILVALVVFIVPELFHGDIAGRASKEAAGNEGPPLRSYTIDLGGSRTAPMQITAPGPRSTQPATTAPAPLPTATADAAGPVASTPTPASTPTLAPAAVTSTRTPSEAPAQATSPAPPSAPPATPAHASVTPAHVASSPSASAAHAAPARAASHIVTAHTAAQGSAPAATQTTTHKSASSAVTAPSGAAAAGADWSVQLGLFAQRSNAERMLHNAQAKGFSASLSKPDAKGRYRVRVAGLIDRSTAMTLVARLRAAGLPAAAVGPQ